IIRAHYGGQVAISRLLVPIRSSAAGNSSPQPFPRPLSLVDPPIFAKLRRLGIAPSPLCSDAVFLRRATLDLTGTLPASAEARRFLASGDPNKRRKVIGAVRGVRQYVRA